MCSGAIPGPSSSTSRKACSRSAHARTLTRVPSRVWVSALSSNVRATWTTRSSSARATGWPSTPTSMTCCLRSASAANSAATARATSPRSAGLLAHRLEELLSRRLVELLVGHQLEEAPEREERRAQLVRCVRDELAAGAIELLQPHAHPLEGLGKVAELVVAGVHDRLVEAAAGYPLGGPLEPADPRRVDRRRAVPHHDGEEKPEQTGDQEASLDQVEAGDRVVEGVAEQDHDAVVLERNRHLREAATAAVDRAAFHPTRLDRLEGERIPGDIEGRGRVRVAEDEWLVLEDRVHDDPRLEKPCGPLGELLLAPDLIRVVAGDRLRVLLELVELRVHELRLERGDDDQVDDAERPGDHDEERQREPEPDPAQDRTAHGALSAPGTGNRRRAPSGSASARAGPPRSSPGDGARGRRSCAARGSRRRPEAAPAAGGGRRRVRAPQRGRAGARIPRR